MILYQTDTLTVRNLEVSDISLLASWLSDPEVLQYYEGRDRPHDTELVRERFYLEDEETRCIFEYKGIPIGYIQFYALDEEARAEYGYDDQRAALYGMDQFIGEPDYWNKGIGTALVSSMLHYLATKKHAERVAIDPQTWNTRALACYEKCGFKRIKLLEAHEQHEGQWRDCWLMEYRHE